MAMLGKFKSGLQTESSGNMSVNELIELLKSGDHKGEYRGASGQGKYHKSFAFILLCIVLGFNISHLAF